jgi:hypothetical protein
MAISQTFLDKLDTLEDWATMPCGCKEHGSICKGCFARQELEGMYDLLDNVVAIINLNYQDYDIYGKQRNSL